jgi:hypothetical protein
MVRTSSRATGARSCAPLSVSLTTNVTLAAPQWPAPVENGSAENRSGRPDQRIPARRTEDPQVTGRILMSCGTGAISSNLGGTTITWLYQAIHAWMITRRSAACPGGQIPGTAEPRRGGDGRTALIL